jgi:hypothetical protein
LRQLTRLRIGADLATLLLTLCFAYFLFWYGVYATGNPNLAGAIGEEDSWNQINTGDPEGRLAINQALQRATGQQLVFVHYSPQHAAHEWLHNSADIDRSRVIWAIDLGDTENATLRRYYPDRRVWLLEPDARPPKLSELPAQW